MLRKRPEKKIEQIKEQKKEKRKKKIYISSWPYTLVNDKIKNP